MEGSPQTRDMVQDDDNLDDENDIEGQELAEMLNGVHGDSNENKQILHGSQDINDEDNNLDNQKRESPSYGDEDEDIRNLDQEMAEKLKEINAEPNPDQNAQQELEDDESQGPDDEGEEEEDDQELIDIDKLNDQEKAILLHYLQDQYNNNPDQLPMPKEVIEQFIIDNQDLIKNMGDYELDYEEDAIDGGEEQIEVMEGENLHQGIDSSEMVVENDGDDNLEQNDQEDAMIIQGEKNIEIDDDDIEQKQLVDGEMHIQGGEQNINEDVGEEVEDEDAQLHQQMMAIQQDNEDEYGEQ